MIREAGGSVGGKRKVNKERCKLNIQLVMLMKTAGNFFAYLGIYLKASQ